MRIIRWRLVRVFRFLLWLFFREIRVWRSWYTVKFGSFFLVHCFDVTIVWGDDVWRSVTMDRFYLLRLVVVVDSGALPPPMLKISSKYAITNLRNFYKFTFNQFSFLISGLKLMYHGINSFFLILCNLMRIYIDILNKFSCWYSLPANFRYTRLREMKSKTAYLIKRKTMKIATRMMMTITVPAIIRMSCRLPENISWILRNDFPL